jgi:hypothetical protein
VLTVPLVVISSIVPVSLIATKRLPVALNARPRGSPGVSQEDLSGRLARRGIQITQTSLSKIENRTRYVMDYEAAALAKVLKVSIAWLYGEEK